MQLVTISPLLVTASQPLRTHMDLNIGAAFFFAARAEGMLFDGGTEGPEHLYAVADALGRPLLRSGPTGAARGVGRASQDPPSVAGAAVKCGSAKCGRIAKAQCRLALCGRCCLRRISEAPDSEPCPVHQSKHTHQTVGALPSPALNSGGRPYKSQARVLLVGIGADELLGGYGRHRTVFAAGGVEALHAEMMRDQARLWQRNLGRDDRCVADSGREAWFPFIDEMVVQFLGTLNIHDIADLSLGQGVGDKRILRGAARLVGLEGCSDLVKRAIQFGTRIAKLTNVDHHGSHRKGRGEQLLEIK